MPAVQDNSMASPGHNISAMQQELAGVYVGGSEPSRQASLQGAEGAKSTRDACVYESVYVLVRQALLVDEHLPDMPPGVSRDVRATIEVLGGSETTVTRTRSGGCSRYPLWNQILNVRLGGGSVVKVRGCLDN